MERHIVWDVHVFILGRFKQDDVYGFLRSIISFCQLVKSIRGVRENVCVATYQYIKYNNNDRKRKRPMFIKNWINIIFLRLHV